MALLKSKDCTPEKLLDKLAVVYQDLEILGSKLTDQILESIPEEYHDTVRGLVERADKKELQLKRKANELESLIKERVIPVEQSVNGTELQAVWHGGHDSFDTKGLLEYAKKNKTVLKYYRQTAPYVSIRYIDRERKTPK